MAPTTQDAERTNSVSEHESSIYRTIAYAYSCGCADFNVRSRHAKYFLVPTFESSSTSYFP